MNQRSITIATCIVMAMFCSTVSGSVKLKAVRETAEYVLKKFGKEVGEETIETLSEKITKYGMKYGDDAVDAIKTTGPRIFKIIDNAGENAPEVIRLLNKHGNKAVWVASKPRKLAIFIKYGDDAAEAMIKHPGVAASIVEKFGTPASRALRKVSGKNARRIAMMSDEGSLAASKNTDEILEVIGRYGDRAAEWVWKHKGALAVAAVASAFIADPEPFLNGMVDITEMGGEMIVKPVAIKAAESLNWNVIIALGLILITMVFLLRFGWQWIPLYRKKSQVSSPEDKS